ncbi:MAG: aminopeptidase, partial [Acidobacteria bacterium]|nr:aminopeptidase [Acidobacteriota bacterium]
GNNAYAKPATALNILRETILGRELFDYAFKEYARRWRFKHPMPADFFRTMEDASGIDLDWFWRGWFYSTDHVDIALTGVYLYTLDTKDPDIEKARERREHDEAPPSLTEERNRDVPKLVDRFPELKDFYNSYDRYAVTAEDRETFEKLLGELETDEQALLKTDLTFYVVELENRGGLVMPVILQITYADGAEEELRIPAEIWRHDPDKALKLLVTDREITSIVLDPHLETADSDLDNNAWPPKPIRTRFELFKDKQEKNPMQRAKDAAGKGSGKR